jgi:TctA family transporter
MIMSKGSLSIFWSNGLVATLITIGIVLLCWPVIGAAIRRLIPARAHSAAV